MLKFVSSDSNGLPVKRRQSQRACELCRKKKKRCEHDARESGNTDCASPSSRTPLRRTIVHQPATYSSAGNEATSRPGDVDTDEADENPRFVGDLNPEGTFLTHTSPANTVTPHDNGVGVWLPRSANEDVHKRTSEVTLSDISASPASASNLLMSHVIRSYVEDTCLRTIPCQADFEILRKVYVDEIHPIFPIIDMEAFNTARHVRPLVHTMLKQVICLAVSSSPRSKRHLVLPIANEPTSSTPLPPAQFAARIIHSLTFSVNTGLVRDKLQHVRILTMLAMFTQLSDDRAASAELAARAVSQVQTMGLHLDTSVNRRDHVAVTKLFCCVWAMDRLDAAIQGRPILMHERDIGRDVIASVREQEGLFRLMLEVILLLDAVIDLYRPGNEGKSQILEDEFLSFEDVLDLCGPIRAPAQLIATVETLYHAIAILSHRSQSLTEPVRSGASHMRQSLSAANVTSIVGKEFRNQLSLLPIVPYAVSLALRVSYRELRLCKSSFTRARARRQLLDTCTTLKELGNIFSSSTLLTDLAEQTVKEMDKVYAAMVNQQRHGDAPESRAQRQTIGDTLDDDGIAMHNLQHELEPARELSSDSMHRDTEAPIEVLDPVSTTVHLASESHPDFAIDNHYDLSDFDVFEHFDPEFDLDAMDAALGDTVNSVFLA